MSASSLIAIHLSRLAEELVIWSSDRFNFVKLPENFTTGSSIMPQKRNPDAAELARGKSGRIIGSLMSILLVLKGLPLSYSKDLQEDKEGLFDSFDSLYICVKACIGMISDVTINKEKMLEASKRGYTTATDLADWLVKELSLIHI